jgi:hypothetical protein
MTCLTFLQGEEPKEIVKVVVLKLSDHFYYILC